MSYVVTPHGLKSWPLAGLYPVPNTFYPQRLGLDFIGESNRQSYETIYRSQPWVFSVVNKLSRGLGRLPFGVFTPPDTNGHSKKVTGSSLGKLLDRPYPRATGFQLREAMTGSLGVYGNSLVVKDRGDGAYTMGKPPVALWPIPWRFVGVIAGQNEPVEFYVLQVGAVRRLVLPEDVIHVQWWAPWGVGISPLEPLRMTLATEDAAQRYSVASFANGARPSGALTTERPLRKNDRDELRAEIEARHGGIDNAFRIALLTNGLTWQPFGGSAVDAELINQRKFTLTEVCAVYDVSPSMIHQQEHQPRAGIDEIHRMMYQDSYGPVMGLEEDAIGVQLIDPEPTFRGNIVRYDLEEVLRGDPVLRSQMTQRLFQSASRTPNELRADDGLPPVPGSVSPDGTPIEDHPANQVYIPVNMEPLALIEDAIENPPSSRPTMIPGQQTEAEPGPGGDPQNGPTPAEPRKRVTRAAIRDAIKVLSSAGWDFNLRENTAGIEELLTEAEWNERALAGANGHGR